jgi:hypothetical protein
MHDMVATYVDAFLHQELYIVLPCIHHYRWYRVGCTDVDPDRQVSSRGVLFMTTDFSISCVPPRYYFFGFLRVPWH